MRRFKLFLEIAVTAVSLVNILALRAQSPAAQTPPPTATGFQLRNNAGSVQYATGWNPRHYANVDELWNAAPNEIAAMGADERDAVPRIRTSVTPCSNHAEALRRLRAIEAEWGMTSKFLVIGGWPALQRDQIVPKPTEGGDMDSSASQLMMVTTAVAAGSTLVRLDGFAPSTASSQVITEMEAVGRSYRAATGSDAATAASEIQQLRNSPSLRMSAPLPPGSSPIGAAIVGPGPLPKSAAAAITPGAATNLGTLDLRIGSESEIAVSSDGANIVVAQQCSFSDSTDGGASFPTRGGSPGNCTGGDSSVAFGKSGNFYWETIGSNTATCPMGKNCNNTQEISRSTNNGQSFSFVTNVIDCQVTSGCGFGNVPDQEHIAADRFNASGSGQDQVYMVFRQGFGFGISCSTDSASTWRAVTFFNNGSTDFPRITVGQDGNVYVVTNNGNNIELDSFSSCQSGLTHNLNHVTVATGINQVSCPVSGLDRCNDGNILSSHTVAVDDTNATHLYASYAVNSVAPPANLSFPGNENVLVGESKDGGATWSAPVQINQGTTATGGRRFQPWVCTTGGSAFVSWFDRRASTSTSNDLTDYYSSSASVIGGTLTAGTEFQIDGAADPQCASGWPCQTRSANDSESCSSQPQLAGTCRHSPAQPTDSNTACDFATTVCTGSETCMGGGGCPKYADYTGNACVLGRLYTVWPSATNQPGAAVSTGGNIFSFFVETVVGPSPTTTTYTGATSQDYHDVAALSATLVLQGTSIPVTGQTISFTIGSQSCAASTNGSGAAACTITLNQIPGPYTVSAAFAATGNYQASSGSKAFTITKEETTLSYTGPTVIANGNPFTPSGVLLEDGNAAAPIQGRSVVFSLGTGATKQTCTGITDVSGKASCTIGTVNQPGGPNTISDNFAGDPFYLPSSNSASAILFSFLTQGSFVVGDKSDAGAVEFWGDDWSTKNLLSGGPAPASFKGFANPISTKPPACGSTWTSRPGNSTPPPNGPLPAYMGLVVSSHVNQAGSSISGDVTAILVVTTNPGYSSDPGHHGTGSVVATYCP